MTRLSTRSALTLQPLIAGPLITPPQVFGRCRPPHSSRKPTLKELSPMISAVVMPAPGKPLELRDFEEPELEPGGVLLKTLGSEVCGTDIHLWKGQLAGVPYPIIPGHVSVGEVAALGPTPARGDVVRDVSGRPIEVGQVVTFLDVFGSRHDTMSLAQGI